MREVKGGMEQNMGDSRLYRPWEEVDVHLTCTAWPVLIPQHTFPCFVVGLFLCRKDKLALFLSSKRSQDFLIFPDAISMKPLSGL